MNNSNLRRSFVRILTVLVFLVSFLPVGSGKAAILAAPSAGPVQSAGLTDASHSSLGLTNWCIAGAFQGWNNTSTPLFDDGTHGDLFPKDGVYSVDLAIASAGYYEWKTVECGNWGNAHPSANAWVITTNPNQVVKFTLDTNDHSADAGTPMLPAQYIPNAWSTLPASFTVVGDFQGWDNANLATLMTDRGHGLYTLNFAVPTAGTYAAKITITSTWHYYTFEGLSTNDAGIPFTTTTPNQEMVFLLDIRTGRVAVIPQSSSAGSWCLTGDPNINNWNASSNPLYDNGTHGDLIGGDGVFSLDFTVPSAGRSEWKILHNCDWADTYPASGNSWLNISSPNQVVKFTLDTNNHASDGGMKFVPTQNIVNAWDTQPASFTAVGSFQGWSNNNPATAMADLGKGLIYLSLPIFGAGGQQMKIVQTGSWDAFGSDNRSVNANNIDFSVTNSGEKWGFLLDYYSGRVATLLLPGRGHDNMVESAGLGHDSRDSLYRTPSGAVPAGTTVLLRLRTFHNDVTGVRVRFFDDRAQTESFQDLSLAASDVSCYADTLADETCDFWQVSVAPANLTTLYYRFIIQDGTGVAYYADDNFKDGGWGLATSTMVDNSYAITVYDPLFAPVPWMKNAIVYQIFPDRFFNGDPTNDPSNTEPRYGYPPSTADQILNKPWSALPEGYCRPYVNPATPCTESPMGRDYFGGDLQGLRMKLDYIKALGVNVIYINPVFEAASDHGYDTQDYTRIDHFFGSNATFTDLINDAHARGMKVILDGVFNHVSSDSPYFDRYHHFSEVGACENVNSPYRSWFTFREVGAGAGVCAGSGGANSATYDGWFGYDSLPVLNKTVQAVRDLVYAASTSIARTWIAAGADGWRLDVMNDGSFPADFWPGFRAAVKDTNPNAVILGELWKKADMLPFVQGDKADSGMTYRFRNAIQGFFGKIDDKGFVDDGQSNQAPSLFANKLLSIREDYPDAAYYMSMNLLDSHDTERILWSLTPGQSNREDKEFNALNLADGKRMLDLAVLVQMTTPGAPTIYYGDEVGMTGATDPDDRRAFPWRSFTYYLPVISTGGNLVGADKVAQPTTNYYGANGDHALLDYYRTMTGLRTQNDVFRNGELSFLLTDDANRTLAYLMRTEDNAAIVAINRKSTSQTLTINVSGLLPANVSFQDALGIVPGSITASAGIISLDLPALSGTVLLPDAGQVLVLPTPPTGLNATPGNAQVALSWTAVLGATTYNIYRSPLTGGGFVRIDSSATASYTDTTATNGKRFYYIVKTVSASGMESLASNEASATPAFPITYATLQWPPTITKELNVTPAGPIYGQVYASGLTDTGLDPALIIAQVGFGPHESSPSGWTTWQAMTYNARVGNNYEYIGTIRPEAAGTYDYQVRFSDDGGLTWVYGGNANGVLTLTPNPDTTPPAAPANLRTTDWSTDTISLAWDTVADAAEYWLYRHAAGGSYDLPLVKLGSTTATYKDTGVQPGITYAYIVKAVDAALNLSIPSNEVTQKAEPKVVEVTFRVRVPDFTPPDDIVYIAGDAFAQQWNPSAYPMTKVGVNIWEFTTTFKDGLTLLYKYARGSWDRVEWWGTITSVANRTVSISFGTTGKQLVDNTATDWGTGADSDKAVQNWRDPLVSATTPAGGSSGTAPADISVSFSRDIQPPTGGDFNSSITVLNGATPVAGTITNPDTTHLVWTPSAALTVGTYTVTVSNLRSSLGGDSIPIQVPYTFTFTVIP